MSQPQQPAQERIGRRNVVRGAAWATPVVLATSAAPAMALSQPCPITIVTAGLSSGGVDLYLRDTKAMNSNTNTSPNNTSVVNLTLRVECNGVPQSGVTIAVAGDETKDGEGNYMIGFSPSTQNAGFGESPTKRTTSGLTDANGEFKLKVSTATYSFDDCGSIPRSGTWTVTIDGQFTSTFTYTVWDGFLPILCLP